MWVSAIDIRRKILPKRILWPTSAAVLALYTAASIAEGEPAKIGQILLAAGSCGALFAALYCFCPEGMGFGDVRLIVLNSLAVGWFGVSAAWVAVAAGFVFAFPLVLWFMFRHGAKKGLAIQSPFGPFLVAGAGAVILAEAAGATSFP